MSLPVYRSELSTPRLRIYLLVPLATHSRNYLVLPTRWRKTLESALP